MLNRVRAASGTGCSAASHGSPGSYLVTIVDGVRRVVDGMNSEARLRRWDRRRAILGEEQSSSLLVARKRSDFRTWLQS